MRRLLITLLLLLGLSSIASARDSIRGYCEEGNRPVITSGLTSTTRVQASHPSCTITINVHGSGLATLYADNNSTPLANPFTAQSNGQFQAYMDNGRYDVILSGAGFSQTVTYSDILLCDPLEPDSVCGSATTGINLSINGGTPVSTTLVDLVAGDNITLSQNGAHVTVNSSNGGTHNFLSTTHLDTVPASPPGRGSIVTAQNLTSPSGVTPAWAELVKGTAGQVLMSTATDAVWGTLAGSGGVTVNNSGSTTTFSLTNTSITVGGVSCTLGSSCTPHVNHGISFTIGDPSASSALTAAATTTDYISIPFACTINRYTLQVDTGTITVKFWKVALGTAIPTSSSSINTSGVGISSGTAITSTTLSDFTTTAVSANDAIAMNVTAVSGAHFVNGVLSCQE